MDGSTRDDLKPRMINCPSMTTRARCGYISFRVLNWLKKNFPEFFLAKTPQDFEEYMRQLDEFPYTY